MPDRMAWSDMIPEVVFYPFLRMRSQNMAQGNNNQVYFVWQAAGSTDTSLSCTRPRAG